MRSDRSDLPVAGVSACGGSTFIAAPLLWCPIAAARAAPGARMPRAPRAQSLRGLGGFELPLHRRLSQFAARFVAEFVTGDGVAASRGDHDHEHVLHCLSPFSNLLVVWQCDCVTRRPYAFP